LLNKGQVRQKSEENSVLMSVIFVILHYLIGSHEMKEVELGGSCNVHGRKSNILIGKTEETSRALGREGGEWITAAQDRNN
jgi:hypothetical protein